MIIYVDEYVFVAYVFLEYTGVSNDLTSEARNGDVLVIVIIMIVSNMIMFCKMEQESDWD